LANKSIIDIQVNADQFKAFFDLFKQYEETLGGMPEDWKKVDAASRASTEAFSAAAGAMVESMLAASTHAENIAKHLKSAAEAQKQFGSATKKSQTGLEKMSKAAKETAESIFGIGKFLFKTAAWGAGLFAGGIYGIDKLAESAVGNQRSALGLGLSTGQFRAFNTDLGRYLNPAILSSVANAQNSLEGRVWLSRAAGLSQSQVQNMNAGDLSAQLAIRAHQWWQNTPSSMRTQEYLQATGFTQAGLSLEDMRRLGATPLGQLQAAQSQYRTDAGNLNISNESTNALYAFTRQLTLAGQNLETSLTKKLSELGPNLGEFITELEKDAETLINSVFTKDNMDAIAKGLGDLATYLGSADFKKDLDSFRGGIVDIANAIKWAVDLIHPGANTSSSGPPRTGEYASTDVSHFLFGSSTLGKWASNKTAAISNGKYSFATSRSPVFSLLRNYSYFNNYDPNTGQPIGMNNPGNLRSSPGYSTVGGFAAFPSVNEAYAGMAWQLGRYPTKFHADTLSSIYSTYDKNDPLIQQKIGNLSKWTGFKANQKLNLNDPDVMSKLISAIVRQESGVRITPQDVEKDIAKSHWTNPAGTSDDIKRLIAALEKQGRQSTNVTLTNKSGTNVAVSTNGAQY
jgi:hypothetical protein